MPTPVRFDWPALLRAGLIGLQLRPEEFWALTPAELKLMLGDGGASVLQRDGLNALMQAFPDEGVPNETEERPQR